MQPIGTSVEGVGAAPRNPWTLADPQAARQGVLWVKWAVQAFLAYWAVFAFVEPVTNFDSQTYNLARLYVAHAGGLFGNHAWANERQIVFPWTFDAIHYPFLFLRWGYCLPSFACFVGLLVIVYRLVAATHPPRQAWWCCFTLLAMPTVIFQAICTKNDLAVVYGIGCWFYAWRLWRSEPRNFYVVLMALALGFTAGAKTNGLLFAFLLGAYTSWQLFSRGGPAFRFAGWTMLFLVLLGSVEIYANNWRLYHAPLGPATLIKVNQNQDGLAGATATFVRYVFGNMDVGVDAANPGSPVAGYLESACRSTLRFTGLQNLGYRQGFGDADANLRFLRQGLETGTDYGPVGALALLASLIFVLARPWSDPVCKLAAVGLAALGLTSYTVAWMMWNARFLILPFCLFAVALTLWLFRLPATGWGRVLRVGFFLLVVYSSIIYPLTSMNLSPGFVRLSLAHRPVAALQERISMLEIVKDLRARAGTIGSSPVLLRAGGDSWVFCIMDIRQLHVVSTPMLDARTVAAAGRTASGASRPVYVLALNVPLDPALASSMTLLSKYAEADSALYEWHPPVP